jgi:dephospho-CoA kinase
MTLFIGVTGGIGSGKSTVCKVFRLLGVPVFEADPIGKYLLDNDENLKKKVADLFGNNIYTSKGTVDREKLAEIIFNDNKKLRQLNELVHPPVKKEFYKWAEERKHFPYVIQEAAILFESGFYKFMDYTILVTAPEKERIERVKKRDNVSESDIMARIKNQYSEAYNRKLASIVLENDNKRLIIPEIIKIDNNLKRYGKIW